VPELMPLRGIHFDPERVGRDLGAVLSPPYDVVDDDHAILLEEKHPYNSVRLELCVPPADPAPARYENAAAMWSSWRNEGVLVQDPAPSLYVYRHSFQHEGRRFVRTAIVGRLGGGVAPHEETMAAPKEDRRRLLRACAAQFSPILALYEDPGGRVKSRVEAELKGRTAALSASLGDEEISLWRLDDEPTVAGLAADIAPLRAVIADGHHRYQSVRQYLEERSGSDDRPGVLAALVATSDPGLLVLPTHRLIRARSEGIDLRIIDAVANSLGGRGEIIPLVDPSRPDFPRSLPKSGESETTFVAVSGGRSWLIRCECGIAGALETMDGAIGIALEIGASSGPSGMIEYVQDTGWAMEEVLDGRAGAVILVPPVSLDEIISKACQGKRFPRKTTYFYPKAPAGLLMLDLEPPR